VVEIIMLPEKPLRLVRVRLDVADVPLLRVMAEGLALMVKSGGGAGVTTRNNCAMCDNLPLLPVMFIV